MIWKVFTHIIHLSSKLSEVAKKRLITASSPIHAAQSRARLKIRIDGLESLFPPSGFLKRRLIRLKERGRLAIPIREAEKRRLRIIRTMPKAMRRDFPCREG